ncbi:hypothetical protein BGZ47_002944 [Haplosporangium gracile]|nr:hypothetical protein BGZ47_002944 [Haplosporangium gracile]
MINFADHPFHRPEPGEMDEIEYDHDSSSPILNSQEAAFAAEHGAFPEHTNFITVTRSKVPHSVRFPVAYFGKESKNRNYMRNWVTHILAEVAPVKPSSFTTAILLVSAKEGAEAQYAEYLLFHVSSAEDVSAACKYGGKKTMPDGTIVPVRFEAHTAVAQAAEQERMIKITALAWNTTSSNIKAALKDWGEIQSVTTQFNVKYTMKEAFVVFVSVTSVQNLKEAGVTCLCVQEDVGTISQLGNETITYDPSLTVKIASLPRNTTPAQLKGIFDTNMTTKNAVNPYHTITMPLGLKPQIRQLEAFVKFSSLQQQQEALKTKITIDNKETIWTTVDKYACFHCGSTEHIRSGCKAFQNVLAFSASNRAQKAAIRSGSCYFQPPDSHLNPFCPLRAFCLRCIRGFLCSKNWAMHFTEKIAELTNNQAKQETDIANINVRMQDGFDRIMALLQGKELESTSNTGATMAAPVTVLEQEDVDLPYAPPPATMVPDSLPSSPVPVTPHNAEPTSDATQGQGRTRTQPTESAAYSVNTYRPNILGGNSIAKSDRQRGESTYTRKKEKQKAVVRDAPQDNTLTPQQQPADPTREAIHALNATIQDLRNELAQQREQYVRQAEELRNENRELRTQLEKLLATWHAHNPNAQHSNYAVRDSQEVEEYGEVEHNGSATPNVQHGIGANTVENTQATQPPQEF